MVKTMYKHITSISGKGLQILDLNSLNLCFETSKNSGQTADGNIKVTWQAPQVTLVLYIFKLLRISTKVLSVIKSSIT